MTEDNPVAQPELPSTKNLRRQFAWFACFLFGLTLAFGKPLLAMLKYSWLTDLHSHAALIPFISVYLIWLQHDRVRQTSCASPALAIAPLAAGLVALKAILVPSDQLTAAQPNDYLALTTFCYLCFLWAGALLFLGGHFFRQHLFPLVFLAFMVPLPTIAENAVEMFFQHTSADAAHGLFKLAGLTFYREGLVFDLPGISIRVAQECSGIRSSLVLFITSLLAGHLFLKTYPRRVALAIFVIPLAIVRNGFRIFTIGMLCVYVSPDMIDSPIHHRGGPVFFALSLIPFFLLLLWLRRGELRRRTDSSPQAEQA